MTINEFHRAADVLIEAFEFGDITYEEFDMAHEGLLEQLNEEDYERY